MVAFEMAVGIPFDRSRIKYKCSKEKAEESSLNTGKDEKIINCKEAPDQKRKSSAKGRKKSLKKGSLKPKKGKEGKRKNSESSNKSGSMKSSEPSNSITKEVEAALKVNPSDDDFIDIPAAGE